MTQVYVSFDTEDYVNPIGADGIYNCATLLTEEGVPGNFMTVAWLAQALKEWGREDVIEAMKKHEIELHSLAHSYHPTINEYTDLEDFQEALSLFLQKEEEAVRIISDIFGISDFSTAVPPGASTSYVAHYGYAKMGLPIYSGDFVRDLKKGRPVWCCNIACLDYTVCLDGLLLEADEKELRELLDKMAELEILVLYHHPQKGMITEFCDELNYKGFNTPKEEWTLSPLRDKAESEKFYRNFRLLLRLIKADPRFSFASYKQLREQLREEPRVVTREQIPGLKAQLENLFPVTTPVSLSLTDIAYACRDLLQGKDSHVCGEVFGFLSQPYAIEAPVTLTAGQITQMASQIRDDFLPEKLELDGITVGPADWLRGALEVLCGAQTVTLIPGPWQIDLDQFPDIRDLHYAGWWVHDPNWKDLYLSDRLRLQSWTLRLPTGSPRYIF